MYFWYVSQELPALMAVLRTMPTSAARESGTLGFAPPASEPESPRKNRAPSIIFLSFAHTSRIGYAQLKREILEMKEAPSQSGEQIDKLAQTLQLESLQRMLPHQPPENRERYLL